MQYRKFGKLDWQVSALGFGAMRLPSMDGDPTRVDVPEAVRMMRYAFDHGVNYVDSAYGYHGGQSERVVGLALREGYRQKVRIATKLPAPLVTSVTDFDRIFQEQLERLQTDRIDFYLLHGMNNQQWPKLRDLGVLAWAEKMMDSGRIGHLGFSFHDEFEVFKEIVDAYDNWSFCQIQYNYLDIDYQAGIKGLKYAAERGMAVVVMEPLRGGRLSKAPDSVARLWANASQKHTPAEWALLWVWDQPEVSLALSGMSTMKQVEENVTSADFARPGLFSADELALIERVRESYLSLRPVPCTGCRYCMPCPSDVEIPRIFELYNNAVMFDEPQMSRFFYRGPGGLKEEQRADRCIECEQCVDACPQSIPVPEWLKKAHLLLGPKPES